MRTKKLSFILLILFLVALTAVIVFTIPTATEFSHAEEQGEINVVYKYNGKPLTYGKLECNKPINQLLSIDIFCGLLGNTIYTDGKELQFFDESTDKQITFPFVPTEDITINVKLVDSTKQFTLTYIYGSNAEIKEEVHTYAVNTNIVSPKKIDGFDVKCWFPSDNFSNKIDFPQYATKDMVLYPLLDKKVKVVFNGKEMYKTYGLDAKYSLQTKTHAVYKIYSDKEKTKEYSANLMIDTTLFGDFVLTHYEVSFTDGAKTTKRYVPIEDPYIRQDIFPTNFGDVEWRIDETKPLEFPLKIEGDITLLATDGMNNPLTPTDWGLLAAVSSIFIAMAAWGAIYEHRKTKKKKQKEQEEKDKPASSEENSNLDDTKPTEEKAE